MSSKNLKKGKKSWKIRDWQERESSTPCGFVCNFGVCHFYVSGFDIRMEITDRNYAFLDIFGIFAERSRYVENYF